MTPQAFIAKWQKPELKERSALQSNMVLGDTYGG